MKKPAIKDLANNCNIPEKLIRAVVRQIGGWEYFQEQAENVSSHGAAGGYVGFTYYSDTMEFYAKNQKEIVEFTEEFAQEIGESGAMECVKNFNCLRGDSTSEEIGKTLYGTKRQHDTNVANAMAWFALEEVCRAYCDLMERE